MVGRFPHVCFCAENKRNKDDDFDREQIFNMFSKTSIYIKLYSVCPVGENGWEWVEMGENGLQ